MITGNERELARQLDVAERKVWTYQQYLLLCGIFAAFWLAEHFFG